MPVPESTTKSVDQCPACYIYSDDLVDDSDIEDCYNGNIDDDYSEICDDDEICGMDYYYAAGYQENGDRQYYCGIERRCGKLKFSLKQSENISVPLVSKGITTVISVLEENGGCTKKDCNNSKWTPWTSNGGDNSTGNDFQRLILDWKILATLTVLIK